MVSDTQTAQTVAISPRPLPEIAFPDDLPVSARRDDIEIAIAKHQVVILSGETGSGKTTQLPKICLAMGRGREAMIAHTQPRRLAATSVARRIAQELQSPLGQWVGYQIRFQQRTDATTAIKLMTDGILLAQTQRDRLLKAYDTIIIDEAHERSLNIDFLLGYLREILPQRPDLKVIITSATIDADRFARHFATPDGQAAPVIEVSGRLYPVEIRYRPVKLPAEQAAEIEGQLEEGVQERDLCDAVTDAVDECARHGSGDILVFLPGEREIRETSEALRKHHPQSTQILPLFSRLSQIEQEEIFRPSTRARRVVLATNVAETSLTVPGIRYVIDAGLARVKRYSWRQKVEQLQIEPISQASANQRAGRCGRLGPGMCIRLYDEEDFKRRRRFSEPEVLRSSLAGVILRMKSLGLPEIERFPFVDPPTGRAIADGYQTLQELGALNMRPSGVDSFADDSALSLTSTGKLLAKLPLDPRVGRMLLAARDQQCLKEMLIIAAAMAVQDPRERPVIAREAAEQAHAKFADKQSEFLAWLKLWDWYHEQVAHKGSQRKLVGVLRQNYLSAVRLREWHDIHGQLAAMVGEQRWRVNQTEATYEQVHSALLTGLIGQVGLKSEEASHYQGVRDLRFWIHPGSKLVRKAGKWVLAGELVETSRLYARCIAKIEPVWIERVGSHLLLKSWGDPRWDSRRGQVVAHEKASLYGLPIYSGRLVHFGPIDLARARETFIREALVPGEIDLPFEFVAHNKKLIQSIERLEHRSRRPDILVDETLIAGFYDRLLPSEICQTVAFKQWFKRLDDKEVQRWKLSKDDLMRHEAAGITTDVFPKTISWQGNALKLDYHFEPGSPKDGVTVSVPLVLLNQLTALRWEWLVPGMVKEKVQWLVKSLPQKLRKHCVPVPDYAQDFHARWFDQMSEPTTSLTAAVIADIDQQFHVKVLESDFRADSLPAHLFMNFRIIDQHGRMLRAGRNLSQLKAQFGDQAQATFQEMATQGERVIADQALERITQWTFESLPDVMEIRRGGKSILGYPGLVDEETHCRIDVFDDAQTAQRSHRLGLLRLLRIGLKEQIKFLEKNLPNALRLGVLYMTLGSWESLRGQIIDAALSRAALEQQPWPKDAESFSCTRELAKERVGLLAQELSRLVLSILEQSEVARKRLVQFKVHESACKDMVIQLSELMPPDFVMRTPYEQLKHLPRYLEAIAVRFDGLRSDAIRDQRRMSEMAPLLAHYRRARQALAGAPEPGLDQFFWMLQELRVALFAQRLRTPYPVSAKRLFKAWEALQR